MRSAAKALGDQLARLIFHQRDQRAHDQRGAAARYTRQLITERLAGARRHDEQHAAAFHEMLADRALMRTKRAEAKAFGENLVE
ncbi:MAG: hypothetical protein QM702_12295 [Rubrivivax sp.]